MRVLIQLKVALYVECFALFGCRYEVSADEDRRTCKCEVPRKLKMFPIV